MNTVLSFKAMNTKENISADIIEKEPESEVIEQAQQTLTDPRPS